MGVMKPAILVRRLLPADSSALIEHLLRLSAQDRRLRFFGAVSDDFIRRHGERIDWRHKILLACFIDGTLRGVAEMALLPTDPVSVEVALTVEQPYQDQGIGSELLRRVIVLARNRFVHTLHLICLPENLRMQRVARKHGARLTIRDGAAEGRIRAPWPDAFTWTEETMHEGLELMRTALAATGPRTEASNRTPNA